MLSKQKGHGLTNYKKRTQMNMPPCWSPQFMEASGMQRKMQNQDWRWHGRDSRRQAPSLTIVETEACSWAERNCRVTVTDTSEWGGRTDKGPTPGKTESFIPWLDIAATSARMTYILVPVLCTHMGVYLGFLKYFLESAHKPAAELNHGRVWRGCRGRPAGLSCLPNKIS